jgi:hypothetical protein
MLLERTVNGRPGLVVEIDGRIVTVFAFEIVGGRIRRIRVVRDAEKLRPRAVALADWPGAPECPRHVISFTPCV